ncbi:MAG TPA: hypothetical protein VHM25_18195 [Polyangiaceae bacterium]|jgi:hypothetical protein|nr:hypothetical protein [Polyangiaceae bacterium]
MTDIALRETAGLWLGRLLAPVTASISHARHARMFHPVGRTFQAKIEVEPDLGKPWKELAARLSGPALARFSGALWRGNFEHWDVLGVALRLRENDSISPQCLPSDQDLLFATIRSPLTMPFAPFTTNAHDYLDNQYWAVSPFQVGHARHVKFRLSPSAPDRQQQTRASRVHRDAALLEAVSKDSVSLRLEVRHTFEPPSRSLATVRLTAVVDLDQEALRFSPFQTGRGIVPSGFVHALRRATYPASQGARPSHR